MAQEFAGRQTMNLEALGKVLGVSRPVIYDLARRDALPVPVIRIGRRMVVSVRAVESLLDQTEVEEKQAA